MTLSEILGVTAQQYNHYVDYMNSVIQAAGGSITEAESDHATYVYNCVFGTDIPNMAKVQALTKVMAAFESRA